MSYRFNVKLSGINKSGTRDRMTIVVYELNREDAKHAAISEAAKYGLEQCSIAHIGLVGIAHTCTFAESVRGHQRRRDRQRRVREKQQPEAAQ